MSDHLSKNHEYYYTDIPWRHSGLRAKAGGVDPIILLLLPIILFTLAQEGPAWLFYVYASVAALICYARFRGFHTFWDWLVSLRTRAQGCQWPTR